MPQAPAPAPAPAASPAPGPAQNLTLHRVKVYKLNNEGGWDDKGTGLVSVEYMKQSDAMGLVVISEEDTRTLLIHRVSKDDIYHRQGDDTIITWTDPNFGTDIALSFQEATGCNHIWEQIQAVQLGDHQPHQELVGQRRRVVDEFESVSGHFEGEFPESDTTGLVDIPAPEMGNLEEIAKVLTHVAPFQRERIAAQLTQPGYPYVKALVELFRQCEDLEDKNGLACMYRIFKGIVMLNDSQIMEELMREEYAMDVMGAFEHDPDLKQPQKHRDYLRDSVTFKEVVPISEPTLVAKIHQTYRMQYLKDVILPRALDDATLSTLNSLALFNNVEVILALHQDASFLPQLFHRLKKHHPGDPEWNDLVAFLQELCSLAKHLQPAHRVQLFSKLVTLGLFETVTKVMKFGSQEVKLRATDVLTSCVSHDPTPLRHFLSQPTFELFSLLIQELLSGEHCGLAEQVSELLKIMMDPETSDQGNEKNEFLDMFYDKYVQKLVQTLAPDASLPNGDSKGADSVSNDVSVPIPPAPALVSAHVAGLIVELLCFCVQNHAYRIKYYILRNQVVERVLRLLKRREKWLVVAAIRFLRTCIGLRDEFYNRYLIRNRVFDPVLDAFLENGDRYNMLNSSVLEMVDFIRRENIRHLVTHFVEQFDARCQHVSYVDTFKQLKIKYEQSQERGNLGNEDISFDQATSSLRTKGGQTLYMRRRRDARDMDKDEEDYFSEDGDLDSDDSLPPGPTHPLRDRPTPPSADGPINPSYTNTSSTANNRPHTAPNNNGPQQPRMHPQPGTPTLLLPNSHQNTPHSGFGPSGQSGHPNQSGVGHLGQSGQSVQSGMGQSGQPGRQLGQSGSSQFGQSAQSAQSSPGQSVGGQPSPSGMHQPGSGNVGHPRAAQSGGPSQSRMGTPSVGQLRATPIGAGQGGLGHIASSSGSGGQEGQGGTGGVTEQHNAGSTERSAGGTGPTGEAGWTNSTHVPVGGGAVVVDSGGWQGLGLVDYDDDDDEEMADAASSPRKAPTPNDRDRGAGGLAPNAEGKSKSSSPGEKRSGTSDLSDAGKRPRSAANGPDSLAPKAT